jgi:hypothetical protein
LLRRPTFGLLFSFELESLFLPSYVLAIPFLNLAFDRFSSNL